MKEKNNAFSIFRCTDWSTNRCIQTVRHTYRYNICIYIPIAPIILGYVRESALHTSITNSQTNLMNSVTIFFIGNLPSLFFFPMRLSIHLPIIRAIYQSSTISIPAKPFLPFNQSSQIRFEAIKMSNEIWTSLTQLPVFLEQIKSQLSLWTPGRVCRWAQ